ncbi:hypothetical protein L1987_00377 [Smallanthus sonchifolius]|uniref:Uncharacterized protein n=1 Tax=Smallanthus sonchifolius TaxID=185202 RepID=A0ACB9K2A6_9ASTR|nr:hypothetical protein L1987_00377 [Smallanthus sonchifolius]
MAEEQNQIELKDLAPFDPTKKKVVIQDPAEDSVEQVVENLEPTFTGLKKKKKKQVQIDLLDDEKDNAEEDVDFFHILHENNPELAGDRRKTVMRPPQVVREGPKRTVYLNFMDHCKTMHRPQEHVMAFLLTELGASGSLDDKHRLVVKGRFASKHFEGIMRRYANEYVICNGCKSSDTILKKDNRLLFLICEKGGGCGMRHGRERGTGTWRLSAARNTAPPPKFRGMTMAIGDPAHDVALAL